MKKVKIWDFDKVIFNNPQNNYTDAYLTEILNSHHGVHPELFTRFPLTGINILFTGRPKSQSAIIIKLCQFNNLYFDETIFSSFEQHDFALNNYIDLYYDWKDLIMEQTICKNYPFNPKVLLDDDIEVIHHFQAKQFDVKLIHVPIWKSYWTNWQLLTY